MNKELVWDELKSWLVQAVPNKYAESQVAHLSKSDSEYLAAVATGMDQVLLKIEDMEKRYSGQ